MYEEAAILVNYRPAAVHLEKTIRDLWFPSQDDWEPVVKVFRIHGHPLTDRCFTFWDVRRDGDYTGRRTLVTVLSSSSITTASEAVRAYIAGTGREQR
jgi:hypothetical protein